MNIIVHFSMWLSYTLSLYRVGFECPRHFNPADFYIHVLAMVAGKEDECRDRIKVNYSKNKLQFKDICTCIQT